MNIFHVLADQEEGDIDRELEENKKDNQGGEENKTTEKTIKLERAKKSYKYTGVQTQELGHLLSEMDQKKEEDLETEKPRQRKRKRQKERGETKPEKEYSTQELEERSTRIKEKMKNTRRQNRADRADRRHGWSSSSESDNSSNTDSDRATRITIQNEERDKIAQLALRLHINGIEVEETINEKRTHESRLKNIIQNPSVYDKINAPEIKRKITEWKHEEWETYDISSVESDIPTGSDREKQDRERPDTKPVLYAKMKGVWAKVYIDQGAQVTVISQDFAASNEMRRTTVKEPVKLSMANGVLEPALYRTQNVSLIIGEFRQRINAYVAPIKNYDAIIGRDSLSKWGAILDLRSQEDIRKETETEKDYIITETEEEKPGLSVYDKVNQKRMHLVYGKEPDTVRDLEMECLSEQQLAQQLEERTDIFLYEIQVTELKNQQAQPEKRETEETTEELLKERQIKEKYKEILKEELPNEMPPDRGVRHYIDLQGRMPKTAPRGFKMSEAEKEFMMKYVQDLLDKGLAQPCMGPYASPILVVKKPHSTDLRCVIDYRKLNEVTVGDEYPQPVVSELLDTLKNAKYFSKMDLLSGFHQVRMAPEDRHKTAFTSPFGTYSFEVMPLGLKNASKTFQRMVESVLREHIGISVIVFIDDILVFSKTLEEHQKHLTEVLEKLKQNKLYLKPKKCEFFRDKVSFLGHVVSFNKVEMDPKKIQIVKDWGELTTKKDVQRFLGFANFYRRFIENFAKIADPLYKQLVKTKNNAKVTPTDESRQAQQRLIDMITASPILTIFDSAREQKVVTDASQEAIAAVLMQQGDDKAWHPVEFQSRALDGDKTARTGEYNYAPRDLELCAISYALQKFRSYLAGNKFTVVSDHKSLAVLEDSKINSGRLARILEQLSEFDFKIEYSKGTSSIITVVDALSRLPRYRKVPEQGEQTEIALFEILGMEEVMDKKTEEKSEENRWGYSLIKTDETLVNDIREGYKDDPYWKKIIDQLKKIQTDQHYEPQKEMKFTLSKYTWDDEQRLLYRGLDDKQVLCLPKVGNIIVNRLLEFHDVPLAGHFGRDKTLASLAKNFFWPGMVTDVDDYVKSCANCQRKKVVKRAPIGLLYPHDRPSNRWETISLDFIVQLPKTKLGNFDAIMTVVDGFSKRAHFIPCNTTASAQQAAQLLRENVIKLHGYPKKIISDRGSIFTSTVWTELFRCLQAKQNLSSSYHPQTDGMSEKENDIIECCIRAFTNYQQDDWNIYLPDFELAINNSKSAASGLSPQMIDTGLEPFLPLNITHDTSETTQVSDLLQKLKDIQTLTSITFAAAQEKQALYANRKRTDKEFKEGDFVMLNSNFVYDPIHTDRQARKLADKWLGPFRVDKKISRVAYKLFIPKGDNIKIHPVIHASNLKKFEENPIRFLDREEYSVPEPITDSQKETVYLVDDILNMKIVRGKREFLIKWTGYTDPSWEKEKILRESNDFIPHIENYLEELQSGEKKVLKRSKRKTLKK